MPGFEDEWPDIQGNILRPYAHPHARYAIVRIDEAVGARRLLTSLLEQRLVTTAARWAPGEKPDATAKRLFLVARPPPSFNGAMTVSSVTTPMVLLMVSVVMVLGSSGQLVGGCQPVRA